MKRQDGRPGRSSVEHPVPQPTIADGYTDLLELLNYHQRQSLVVRLTVGYYDGWRPSRSEVADMVAVTLKTMTIEESIQRQRIRSSGRNPPSIVNTLLQDHPDRRRIQ